MECLSDQVEELADVFTDVVVRTSMSCEIDRTSLFRRRARAPDKSTATRRFRGSGVTAQC